MAQLIRTAGRIAKTDIVVDYWLQPKNCKLKRFLTSVGAQNTEFIETLRTSCYCIYTSKYNKKLLVKHYQIESDRIIELPMNELLELNFIDDCLKFRVTLFDANYDIGSLMFLFQGDFGNILYTGLCGPINSSHEFWKNKEIKRIVREKCLDTLYIDNTYAAQHCNFPSRKEAIKQLIILLRKHREKKVFICGIKRLGKEEVIVDISSTLHEKIIVSEEKYKLFTSMFGTDYVTTDTAESRITMVEGHLRLDDCKRLYLSNHPCIVILLTAYSHCTRKNEGNGAAHENIYTIPYSGHASHADLMSFVAKLRPRTIKPVIINSDNQCHVIPSCMYELCYTNGIGVLPDSDDIILPPLEWHKMIRINTRIMSQLAQQPSDCTIERDPLCVDSSDDQEGWRGWDISVRREVTEISVQQCVEEHQSAVRQENIEQHSSSNRVDVTEISAQQCVEEQQSTVRQENVEQMHCSSNQEDMIGTSVQPCVEEQRSTLLQENIEQVSENMEFETESNVETNRPTSPSNCSEKSEVALNIASGSCENRKEKTTSKNQRLVKIYPELEAYTFPVPNSTVGKWEAYFLQYMDHRALADRR